MNKKEFLLRFLDLAKTIKGRTKFQKMIFLAKQEFNLDLGFEFKLYYYGPYSFDLSDFIREQIKEGNIVEDTNYFDMEGNAPQYDFKLTQKGKEKSESLSNEFDDKIKKVINTWNTKSYTEIINHVYDKYVNK
jgi:hypothetical protein